MFGGQTLATAILDRLLHHATTVTIKGESFRLKERRRSGLMEPKMTLIKEDNTKDDGVQDEITPNSFSPEHYVNPYSGGNGDGSFLGEKVDR